MFHGFRHDQIVMPQFETMMTYLVAVVSPVANVVPSLSCFGVEGVGSDGVEQGAGFFLGYYERNCPILKSRFCYAIYTVCFSTSFVDLPYEAIYAEINHNMQPRHWVRLYRVDFKYPIVLASFSTIDLQRKSNTHCAGESICTSSA